MKIHEVTPPRVRLFTIEGLTQKHMEILKSVVGSSYGLGIEGSELYAALKDALAGQK